MGKWADELAASKKRVAEAAEKDKANRASSRKAYEESGAAKQVEAMKKAKPAAKTETKPTPGSVSGAAKRKLLRGEGIWK